MDRLWRSSDGPPPSGASVPAQSVGSGTARGPARRDWKGARTAAGTQARHRRRLQCWRSCAPRPRRGRQLQPGRRAPTRRHSFPRSDDPAEQRGRPREHAVQDDDVGVDDESPDHAAGGDREHGEDRQQQRALLDAVALAAARCGAARMTGWVGDRGGRRLGVNHRGRPHVQIPTLRLRRRGQRSTSRLDPYRRTSLDPGSRRAIIFPVAAAKATLGRTEGLTRWSGGSRQRTKHGQK